MKILSADEMRSTDRLTTERYGVPSLDLMEHAGRAVACFVLREFPEALKVVVLCGKGNNGGDGFVAARMLQEAGRKVQLLLLGYPDDLKGDAKAMFERLDLAPIIAADEAVLGTARVTELLDESQLLVDAVVGTGFKPPLKGVALALRDRVNSLTIPIVAVDIPSGWDADSREYLVAGAYRTDAVVTFTAPKRAHVFGNLTDSAYKPIVVAPIGSPDEAAVSSLNLAWAGASKRITETPRPADSNKGKNGHVLVIGGSYGKAGAPSMAALAALRTGAGLVTAAVPQPILSTVARVTPELMTIPLRAGNQSEISSSNVDADTLDELLEKKTVLAIGPGLGQSPEAEAFLLGLLEKTKLPVVLDADALNILARHPGTINGRDRLLVLTPHPGEMARLGGMKISEVQAGRENLARHFASEHHVTLVLKGWRTLIAHPDGSIAINTTGNPGMAKGGSGDILTGIIAAMLAQYPHLAGEAINAAVYLHGLAADFAVREEDEHTLLATDTVAHLSSAFRFRSEDKGGYVWIQGMPR
ncbi:NAD(P)H-hydrate dehydratase [Alloacidobacterium sp.]|uniref:NAD(P)H-hydrate dehydratase n=1 Tax=Alloacidobacterium sp. TaxID=2951999 RepID=UPI002D5C5088|nr:NAD(P)H-hydrate dehydratase [Alloacidobacterium sp.]HYK37207.1 NAD(P)H-hydrate dehydratase [Alloacidobacterium sp.]